MTSNTSDDRIRAVAAEQFGVITRKQALDCGLDEAAMARRLRAGEWRRLSRRVLRASAAPEHLMLSVVAAVLDTGGEAAVCRESAAALWGLPGFTATPVHVVRDRRIHLHPSRLAMVHTSREIPLGHLATVEGVLVTTPLRTIFDLAATLHPKRTERLLDNAAGRGLCTYQGLHAMLSSFAGRGRAGVELLRELAVDRPAGSRPPESGLEARVNHLLVEDGQRPLDRQVDLGDDEHWTGRFDLVDRADNFVLEVQSDTYHGSVLDRRRDAERRAELESAGWVVTEALAFDIWHRPQAVLETVRAGRRRGRQARSGASDPAAA